MDPSIPGKERERMTRAVVLGIIDFIVVFAALVWLGVVWPLSLLVALLAGICTTVVLVLVQRDRPNPHAERGWWVFILSGLLGILMGVFFLLARYHPVLVILEITVSLMMLGVGLHYRSKYISSPQAVSFDAR